jgi:DNA-binding beta-propeller fold protein YncE
MRGPSIVAACIALLIAPSARAKEDPPPGILAASVEQSVLVADPVSGAVAAFETGPVGFLFEGPGGVLFAPDLVDGRTTVIDLRTLIVADRLDGVTMPHFAPQGDRYTVVAGEVLLVTYPERAVITRVDAGIRFPWQVEMVSGSVMLVLERAPDGTGEAVLHAVDLVTQQVVYRRPLPGDVRRFALSRLLGLLGFADASSSTLQLVAPATLTPVASLQVDGKLRDVAFLDGDPPRIAAVAAGDGGGELKVWTVKQVKGELKIKKEQSLPLPGAPSRLAVSPARDRLAVAVEKAGIMVVDARTLEVVLTIGLPASPRDLVWCDPTRPGPLLPDWSDQAPPELRLGPG